MPDATPPPPVADLGTLLTVPEVAVRLRRTPAKVYELIRDGALRATNTGGRAGLRVPETWLKEFVLNGQQCAPTGSSPRPGDPQGRTGEEIA